MLGVLEELTTLTGWQVTPIVGAFLYPYKSRINLVETETVLGVPSEWLADPANLEVQ